MVALRLTAANLEFLKRHLRRIRPDIKSSHLTEALAAAFGRRTHASLKAEMTQSSSGSENVALFQPEGWTTRLAELGYATVDTSPLIAAAWSPILPDPCWREVRKRDHGAIDDWFYYCRDNNLPDVLVEMARKYATLRWDCISVDPQYEAGVRGQANKAMLKRLFATFQHHAKADTGRPIFQGSSFVGTIERLLPETARSLADEFFIALYGATRTRTEAP